MVVWWKNCLHNGYGLSNNRLNYVIIFKPISRFITKKDHLENWQTSNVNMCVTKRFIKKYIVEKAQNYFPFKREDKK